MLPHAPGVQMQAIPEDAVPDDTVDEDTEDPDKRLSSKTAVHFHTISPLLHAVRMSSYTNVYFLSSQLCYNVFVTNIVYCLLLIL